MQTPIIETERMILRPLTVADAEDIYERWTSDDRVSKMLSDNLFYSTIIK